MLRTVFLAIAITCYSGCGGSNGGGADNSVPPAWPDVVNVRNPVSLPAQVAAQRVPVGLTGDYKPDLVILSSGAMLLVMFQPVNNPNGTYQENMILYRSEDGGQTWGTRDTLPLLGREPYFTLLSDGTLFITASFISADYRNTAGYTYAIVYRSEDSGATWTSMSILSGDVLNVPPGTVTVTSRNLIQLADGTLLLGVGAGTNVDYLWRSQDEGVTWNKDAASAGARRL
ncbi:MAG: sialidase family protein [Steroidobacteraceae bacterium]